MVTLSLIMVTADVSEAHALFTSASPAPGAQLSQSPPHVRIEFSEPVSGGLSGIDLYHSDGSQVSGPPGMADPADSRAYERALPALSPDRYTVAWHSVSLIDGHLRRGSYTFTLLEPGGAQPPVPAGTIDVSQPPRTPAAADAAGKWLQYVGIALAAGVLLFVLLGSDIGARERPARVRFAAIAVGALILMLAGAAEQLLSVVLPSGPSWSALRDILSGRFGSWWLTRVGSIVITAVLMLAALRSPPRARIVAVASAVSLALVVYTFAATSHGAASAVGIWGTFFDFTHLAALAVWIGGVIILATAIFAPWADGATDRRHAVRRFSLVAGIGVALVIGTGIANTIIELAHVNDLWRTAYGQVLLAKLGLVLGLATVAGANAFVLRRAFVERRAHGHWLVWTIALEGALGLAVLVPAAVMTIGVPARSSDDARATAQQLASTVNPANSFSAQTSLAGLAADLSLTPGAPGVNHTEVELPAPASFASVRLTVSNAGSPPATAVLRVAGHDDEGTHYTGTITLPVTSGSRSAVISADGDTSPPIIIPVSPAQERAGSTLPVRSAPMTRWLWVALLGTAAAAAIGATRLARTPGVRRSVFALALVETIAAVALVGWIAAGQSGAPRGPSWGVAARVAPKRAGDLTLWKMPTPAAGLMMPTAGPDGAIWVAEMSVNRLARLLPSQGTVQEFTFPAPVVATMGVAVDASNRVWLAQEGKSALALFDPETGSYVEFKTPTVNSGPSSVAISADGSAVWMTELGAGKIARFDVVTRSFTEYAIPTPQSLPYWLSIAPDGTVWFTEFSGKVGALSPTTGEIREYALPGSAGIAVDRGGRVWVGAGDAVYRIDAASGAVTKVLTADGSIYGVAAARDGTIWAGTSSGTSVYELPPGSSQPVVHEAPVGSGPWWPTVAPDGTVWFALGSAQGNALARVNPP